ncbi:MAG: hypothetical protein ACXVA9_05485 [Bdellovibrionales bacterium]
MRILLFSVMTLLAGQAYAGDICNSDNNCMNTGEICVAGQCMSQTPVINQGEICARALCICSTDGSALSEGGYCQPQFRGNSVEPGA